MKALNSALRNMRRTPYQTISSLLVMVLTFFLLLLFIVVSYGSNRILQYIESLPKVQIYFKIDAKEDDVMAAKQRLEQTGKVAEIKYISKDEALKFFNASFQEHTDITQFVQKDFLPMSLDIQTYKPEDLKDIAELAKTFPSYDEIVFPKDQADRLLYITRALRVFGLVITTYSVITAIFTILIVIGMKIANKKDEIEIMQLLGATAWYIRKPFLTEGILYGIIGAFVAFIAGLVPYLYFEKPLNTFFSDANFVAFPTSPTFFGILLLIQLGIGIVIGLIGSYLAISRYLKG